MDEKDEWCDPISLFALWSRDRPERELEERGLASEHVRATAVVRNECGDDTESSSCVSELGVRDELSDHEEHERKRQEEE